MNSTINTEYISLGSNCSVAYHLHKNNLRKNGYPFDWSKSTLTQLLSSLQDNCLKYTNTLEISNFSNSHPYIKIYGSDKNLFSQIGTYKCKNVYGITMSHELVKKNDFTTLKEKLDSRIKRLYSLKDNNSIDNIIFIRVETKIIPESYKKNIDILMNYLHNISGSKEFKLKLVLHNKNKNMNDILQEYIYNNSLEIIFYNNFSPDWKMEMVNWNNILEI